MFIIETIIICVTLVTSFAQRIKFYDRLWGCLEHCHRLQQMESPGFVISQKKFTLSGDEYIVCAF